VVEENFDVEDVGAQKMMHNILISEHIQLQKHPMVYHRIGSENDSAALCNII
jgi:hypothetical protein